MQPSIDVPAASHKLQVELYPIVQLKAVEDPYLADAELLIFMVIFMSGFVVYIEPLNVGGAPVLFSCYPLYIV